MSIHYVKTKDYHELEVIPIRSALDTNLSYAARGYMFWLFAKDEDESFFPDEHEMGLIKELVDKKYLLIDSWENPTIIQIVNRKAQ